jgi:hypothetical protein
MIYGGIAMLDEDATTKNSESERAAKAKTRKENNA